MAIATVSAEVTTGLLTKVETGLETVGTVMTVGVLSVAESVCEEVGGDARSLFLSLPSPDDVRGHFTPEDMSQLPVYII